MKAANELLAAVCLGLVLVALSLAVGLYAWQAASGPPPCSTFECEESP